MDIQNRLKRFKYFIKDNSSPLLVDFLKLDYFDNYALIDASISKDELYNRDALWVKQLKSINSSIKFLIIKDITKCPISEQNKFIPLVKDKNYSDLKDTIIMFLDENYQRKLIDKELLSYLVII